LIALTHKPDDPLFDRVSADQFIDKDGLCLADPVGSVGRLVLDRRVPSGVVMDHRVGRGEVQAATSRFQADQENWYRPRLKTADRGGSIASGPGQLDMIDFSRSKFGLDQIEHFSVAAAAGLDSAALRTAANQAIFAFVPAALGLLSLILTVAAVQSVGAAIAPGCFGKSRAFAPRY
jgi:hypothetical protein